MARPRFGWNERAGRYVDLRTKRFVKGRDVRLALDEALKAAGREMRALSEQLRAGEITLAEWQVGMRDAIRRRHVYSAAIARGGWAQMSQADWGRVGPEVKRELEFLQAFAEQIESGRQPLDGRFIRRAEMYAEAGRGTYHVIEKRQFVTRGYNEARRVLGAADHCNGCVEQAARGWVPIDDVAQIGSQECRSNCHCDIEYRNTVTGDGDE